MEQNLPATRAEEPLVEPAERPALPPERPISVAYLPLALVAFIIIAFAIAVWTFVSTSL